MGLPRELRTRHNMRRIYSENGNGATMQTLALGPRAEEGAMKIHSPVVVGLRSLCPTVCCLLVLLSSSPLRAQHTQLNTTGNAFYELCKSQSTFYMGCIYYVIGYADGLNLANGALAESGQPKLFCMPSTGIIPGVQMVDMIVSYLQRNPELGTKNTAALIIDAFKEAFPCR
jgi:Rap1a immunity proteins